MEISSRVVHSLKFPPSVSLPTFLIVLNRKLKRDLFRFMHSQVTSVICTDGGANHLYEEFSQEELALYTPNTVIGDFDSIRDDVKEYFRGKGSEIVHSSDEDTTDFEKSMIHIFGQ